MRHDDYAPVAVLFTWLALMWTILRLVAKRMDMWYVKKDKEKKTDILCPATGKPLNTTEVFMGHCFVCMRRIECAKDIKEGVIHVKS